MMKTTKKLTKKQAMLDAAAKDERLRILWMINDMIFSGDYRPAALEALTDLHKKILDNAE